MYKYVESFSKPHHFLSSQSQFIEIREGNIKLKFLQMPKRKCEERNIIFFWKLLFSVFHF